MRKCEKGVVGNPVFARGDRVGFYIQMPGSDSETYYEGSIYIVDKFGTYFQDEEPSYDIILEDPNNPGHSMLIKHLRESHCYEL